MSALHLHPSRNVRARGQELVEFALIIPLLFLFIYGVIDFARVFQTLVVINNAAREGARYGVLYGLKTIPKTGMPDCYAFSRATSGSPPYIIGVTKNEDGSNGVDLNLATVTVQCTGSAVPSGCDCNGGDRLKVTVSYPFQMLFIKIFSWNFPALFTFTRSAEMEVP